MQKEYARLVSLAAWAATVVATLLLLIKVGVWWVTGSVSLLASVVDSFLDIGASLVNLLVLKYALQPADKEHAFGHGKAESLAALAQAMFITGSAMFLMFNGVERLFRPQVVHEPQLGIAVSVLAIVLTLILVIFQKYVIKKTNSQAISADSLHYQSDLLMNVAIIVALVLSWTGFTHADAIFALLIGAYIMYSASRMAYQATQTLLDRKLPDEELIQIRAICLSVEHVIGVHGLRTRMSGPTRFIQLHLELDDNMPLIQAHDISDQVEHRLLDAFPDSDILVHQDPYSVILGPEREAKLRGW